MLRVAYTNEGWNLLNEAPPKRNGQEAQPPTTASVPPEFAPSQQGLRDLRDPQHEGSDALREMQHRAKLFDTQNGIPHSPHSERLAASMLVFAVENGFRYQNVSLEKNQDTGQEAHTVNREQAFAKQQALSQQQSQHPQPDGPSGPSGPTMGPQTM